jgi:hypothetical protein
MIAASRFADTARTRGRDQKENPAEAGQVQLKKHPNLIAARMAPPPLLVQHRHGARNYDRAVSAATSQGGRLNLPFEGDDRPKPSEDTYPTLKPMDCRTEPPRPLSDVISSTLDCGLIRRHPTPLGTPVGPTI